jgi:autotransporter-associated beta strand protein
MLMASASGQTVRDWTSNSDQRWSRSSNWSGNNVPSSNTEIAQFGTGTQLNPQLNANNYDVRGLRFSAGASSYMVGDDNGSRTLKIGNGTSGFIENLSASDQIVSIATLQFQSASTISATGAGALSISSNLTGTNRSLTFNASSDISVSGNITTGSGTLTKQGTGDLHLSGANTFTGLTTISAGTIVAEAAGVFANANRIDVSAGAGLNLNGFAETIGRLTGAGTFDLGASGTGQLTLSSGNSTFSGTVIGAGEIIIGAGATLTLGMDFTNTALNIRLAGGTLQLAGHSLTVGALNISVSSIIDFSAGLDSALTVQSLGFGTTGIQLTAQNWADAADYFFSNTGYVQGSAPLNQVQFTGWTTGDTKWQSYDSQVTPVPEPAAYGAWLLAGGLAAGWWRRRQFSA